MSIDGSGGEGEMTLAFSLSAIERLEDPAGAFEDARDWSQYVGVLDNDPEAVERTVEEYDLAQDFPQGDRDIWLAMEAVRESTHTPRHVYVGTTAEDRRVATQLDWEFVSVTEAAAKAEWSLSGQEPAEGLVARVRRAIPDWLRSFGSR